MRQSIVSTQACVQQSKKRWSNLRERKMEGWRWKRRERDEDKEVNGMVTNTRR
jgi:hypothetical protein